ncbi:MAG: hypothetical protein R2712_04375 [Vicinamibacterales bacterium]
MKAEFTHACGASTDARPAALADMGADIGAEVASCSRRSIGPMPAGRGRIGPVASIGDAAPPRHRPMARARCTLGRGGMGVVYRCDARADDVVLRAAVKVVAGVADSSDVARPFRAERRILASLSTIPACPPPRRRHHRRRTAPYLFLRSSKMPVTDYAATHTLDVRARTGALSTSATRGRVRPPASGGPSRHQARQHPRGRPADGTPKLLDFGIAKMHCQPKARRRGGRRQ